MLHREVPRRIVDHARIANVVYIVLGSLIAVALTITTVALFVSLMEVPASSAPEVRARPAVHVYNVQRFGTHRDGADLSLVDVYPDTDAIQDAINAACLDITEHPVVYFPAGWYEASIPEVWCDNIQWHIDADATLNWH